MNASLLKIGKIPAKTECPFKNYCDLAKNNLCPHKGTEEEKDFECKVALNFDLCQVWNKLPGFIK
ncbi:MAG: hypothetical protein LC122_13980 [Chitinophagales bacterium]|nr:hypothetical protein [Chitinophagales bacterium]